MPYVCKNLKSGNDAIPSLFKAVKERCYDERLLITHAKCEEMKFFLYSIRDYLSKHPAEKNREERLNTVDPTKFSNRDLQTDTSIKIDYDKSMLNTPSYVLTPDGIPTGKAVAVNILTKETTVFSFNLGSESKRGNDGTITTEMKANLNKKFEDLQQRYGEKYVLYKI